VTSEQHILDLLMRADAERLASNNPDSSTTIRSIPGWLATWEAAGVTSTPQLSR
jgi:hypothetical protein